MTHSPVSEAEHITCAVVATPLQMSLQIFVKDRVLN